MSILNIICVIILVGCVEKPPDGNWQIPAKGTCECIHPWGRTALVNVKSVHISLEDGNMRLNAEIEQPFLDGATRKGYFFSHIEGPVTKLDGPIELIDRHSTFVVCSLDEADDKEIKTVRTAKVVIENGKLISVMVVQEDQAMFDIPKLIKLLRQEGGMFAERDIEDLQTFKDGMRRVSFQGTKVVP